MKVQIMVAVVTALHLLLITFQAAAIAFYSQMAMTIPFGYVYCEPLFYNYYDADWNAFLPTCCAAISCFVNFILCLRTFCCYNTWGWRLLELAIGCILNLSVSITEVATEKWTSVQWLLWFLSGVRDCKMVPTTIVHNLHNNFYRVNCGLIQLLICVILTIAKYYLEILVQSAEADENLRWRISLMDNYLDNMPVAQESEYWIPIPSPPPYNSCVVEEDIAMQDVNVRTPAQAPTRRNVNWGKAVLHENMREIAGRLSVIEEESEYSTLSSPPPPPTSGNSVENASQVTTNSSNLPNDSKKAGSKSLTSLPTENLDKFQQFAGSCPVLYTAFGTDSMFPQLERGLSLESAYTGSTSTYYTALEFFEEDESTIGSDSGRISDYDSFHVSEVEDRLSQNGDNADESE